MSDYVVEVRVYRHNEREDMPVALPTGLIQSTVVRFGNATNATTVADRAAKALLTAEKSGVNRLAERVKPGTSIGDALRAAGLHPLET